MKKIIAGLVVCTVAVSASMAAAGGLFAGGPGPIKGVPAIIKSDGSVTIPGYKASASGSESASATSGSIPAEATSQSGVAMTVTGSNFTANSAADGVTSSSSAPPTPQGDQKIKTKSNIKND